MIVTVLQLIAVFGVPVLILRQREKGLVRTFARSPWRISGALSSRWRRFSAGRPGWTSG